jgi:hypothetical protein
MDTDTTNLVGGDDRSLATVGDDVGVGAEGVSPDTFELDEDGNPIAPPEDEEVEVEDGLKMKVPRDLAQKVKEGFLRQSDYTRKTQEVAELRRAVEAERQSIHQASEAEIGARAALAAIDQELAGYARVDWDALEVSDPLEAQHHFRVYQQLQTSRQQAIGAYQNALSYRVSATQQDTARRIEAARAELTGDPEIKWSPQKAAEVLTGAQQHYKLEPTEVDEGFQDARLVRILHDALQWQAHKAKAAKAQGHVSAQQVKPAARAGGSSPPPGLDDRLSADEWVKRRNDQVRKRAGR